MKNEDLVGVWRERGRARSRARARARRPPGLRFSWPFRSPIETTLSIRPAPRKAIDPGCTRDVQGAEYRLWGWGVAVVRADVRGRLAGAASAAMLLLAACTHDPYVNATNTTPSGEWRIERQIDRVTGAPISSVLLM